MHSSFLQSVHTFWTNFNASEAAWPLFLEAVVGMAVGSMLGILVRLFRQQPLTGVLIDGALGAIAFVGGVIGTILMPFTENTVTYKVGDAIVRTTTKRYQHPYQAAFIAAVLLPALWELIRYFLTKRATVSK